METVALSQPPNEMAQEIGIIPDGYDRPRDITFVDGFPLYAACHAIERSVPCQYSPAIFADGLCFEQGRFIASRVYQHEQWSVIYRGEVYGPHDHVCSISLAEGVPLFIAERRRDDGTLARFVVHGRNKGPEYGYVQHLSWANGAPLYSAQRRWHRISDSPWCDIICHGDREFQSAGHVLMLRMEEQKILSITLLGAETINCFSPRMSVMYGNYTGPLFHDILGREIIVVNGKPLYIGVRDGIRVNGLRKPYCVVYGDFEGTLYKEIPEALAVVNNQPMYSVGQNLIVKGGREHFIADAGNWGLHGLDHDPRKPFRSDNPLT